MEKLELPFELVFYIDQEQSCKILPDISTPNLIELYKKEEDVDVRRAMAPELSKRLAELVRERNFKVVF